MGGETHSNVAPSMAGSAYPQLAVRPVGQQITHIYKDRLKQFTDGGQYKEQGLLAKLYDGRLSGEDHIKLSVWDAPDLTRPTFKEATKSTNEYRKTKVGESFGPSWSTHWFKVQFKLPYEWTYKSQVELHWDANNEGLVWTEDGRPLQGLTGGGERVEWVVPLEWRDYDKWHTIYIEMACNGMFGNAPGGDSIQPPRPDKYFKLAQADMVSVNLDARALFYDFWIIGDAAREFPESTWQQHQALQVCNDIMDCFIRVKAQQFVSRSVERSRSATSATISTARMCTTTARRSSLVSAIAISTHAGSGRGQKPSARSHVVGLTSVIYSTATRNIASVHRRRSSTSGWKSCTPTHSTESSHM
jgi:alpha-mannosidase